MKETHGRGPVRKSICFHISQMHHSVGFMSLSRLWIQKPLKCLKWRNSSVLILLPAHNRPAIILFLMTPGPRRKMLLHYWSSITLHSLRKPPDRSQRGHLLLILHNILFQFKNISAGTKHVPLINKHEKIPKCIYLYSFLYRL